MPYFPLALIRNIRAARKAARLTQEQLAEELGISALSYGKLERGYQPISLARLAQIADILDTTVYALLDGCVPGVSSVSTPPQKAAYSEETEKLLAACSPEGQRLIRDMLWLIVSDYDI